MKGCFKLFVVAVFVALAASSGGAQVSPVEKEAFGNRLKKCAFALYIERKDDASKEDAELMGSGVFVGKTIGGMRRIFAVTARHVILSLFRDKGFSGYQFGTLSKLGDMSLRRASVPGPVFKWELTLPEYDIAVADVTKELVGLESNQCAVYYIDLDARGKPSTEKDERAMQGVGTARKVDFDKLDITIGSSGVCVSADRDVRQQKSAGSYDWKNPFVALKGCLLKLDEVIMIGTVCHKVIQFENPIQPGFSGGAQYAFSPTGDPYLVGIQIAWRKGRILSHVIPIDALYDKLEELYPQK